MGFKFVAHELPGVILIETDLFGDARGFFTESYRASAFAAAGITDRFVQDNHSRSSRGILRGLHYQRPPAAQAKLVRVIRGEIFDVAVDIRVGSPSFCRWTGAVLSEDNHRMLYIPRGFAHGFCVLSEVADVVYKVDAEYSAADEGGIIYNDPAIDIRWPIDRPLLSAKDLAYPGLNAIGREFVFSGAAGSGAGGGTP